MRDPEILDGLQEIGVHELFHDVDWDLQFHRHEDGVQLSICMIKW